MKCWNCGADLNRGDAFCNQCGAKQESSGFRQEQDAGGGGYQPQRTASGGGMVLTALAAVCMAVCAALALRSLISVLGMIPQMRWIGPLLTLRSVAVQFAGTLLLALLAVVCALTAFKRTARNSDGLLVCLAVCSAVYLAVRFIMMLLDTIIYAHDFPEYFGSFVLAVLGVVVLIGGIYLVERFVLGEQPLVGKNLDDLKMDVQEALNSFQQTAGEVGAKAAQAAQDAKNRQEQQRAAAAAAQQAQYSQYQYNNQGGYQQGPQGGGQYYGQPTPPNGGGYAPIRLKADRSLIAYIFLTIITCGLYSWYFIYALARDVNIACAGDGRSTAGLIKLVLLSMITCGFYSFYWYYSLGNRLSANAPRYGMAFQENGTTILLWMIIGSLACGLGPLVGLHIIIKNTNALCGAYNYQHGI